MPDRATSPRLGASKTHMLRIAVSVWCAGAVLCCGKQDDSPPKKASVEGVVIDSLTKEPLRKAHVSLSSSNKAEEASSYGTITSDGGEFSFDGLDPGEYVLSAEKIGYLGYPTHGYGGDSVGRTLHLQLSAGQELKPVELKLTPEGGISGRIVDSDGDLCEHCSIAIFTYIWKSGKRRPENLESGDDLDNRAGFHFAGLAPGKYYLYAKSENFFENERRVSSKQTRSQGPVLTFFGDTTDPDRAAPIILAAGQQVTDLEIRLQDAAVYSIKGTVAGLETVTLKSDDQWPPGLLRQTYASIRPKGSSDQVFDSTTATVRRDGSFEISGVPSGTYELTVSQAGAFATIARTAVDVGDHDVSGVLLHVMPLQSISGKIEVEDNKSIDLSGMVVTCEDDQGNSEANVRIKPDRSFSFVNLSPEKYRLHVWGEPKGTYVKAVTVQGVELPGGLVDFTSGNPPPIAIVLSTHAARLQGLVLADSASGGNHSSWKVVLIPDSSDPAPLGLRSRTASVDQNGGFTLETIAPGSYKLHAFEKVVEDAWDNPDFLKQLQADAQAISLKADQAAQVTLPLISSRKTEQLLANLGFQ